MMLILKLRLSFCAACLVALVAFTTTDRLHSQEVRQATMWPAELHQRVIVKATALMPEGLQRQILRYRAEILHSCMITLAELDGRPPVQAEVAEAWQQLHAQLTSRTHFRRICIQLGRLSTLSAEYASALRGVDSAASFADFVTREQRNLPVIIDRMGEAFLRDGSMESYLQFMFDRSMQRRSELHKALESESSDAWADQRSATYGMAILCFNDMISNTARLWLSAWSRAGGDIGNAPYFNDN